MFVQRAYKALDALTSEEYYRRPNAEMKALIEEVLPIATFLKHMETAGRTVRCRYAGGSASPFDAQITIAGREVERGFLEPMYHLEVTTAENPKEHLRRESLWRHGSVYGGPGIWRVGSKAKSNKDVKSVAVAVYGTAAAQLMAELVNKRVSEKAERQYPSPSMLVVNASPDKAITVRDWANVADAAAEALARSSFDRCYIVEWGTNTVIPVSRWLRS